MAMQTNLSINPRRLWDTMLEAEGITIGAAQGVQDIGRRNVVPGEVCFTADIRHPDEALLDAMEAAFLAALAEAAKTNGLEVEQRRNWHSPAIAFDAGLIECVKLGADKVGLATRDMLSGAGTQVLLNAILAYDARLAETSIAQTPEDDLS